MPATYTADYATIQNAIQSGSIVIERAWLELQPLDFLTVRVGQFFTPFGIWNVDHGSPTLIGPQAPFPVIIGLFPNRQVGFELYGSRYVGEARVGYHLTLSNGRIDKNAPFKNTSGKLAVGGRAFVEGSWFGEIRAGLSGYVGRYRDNANKDYNAYVMGGGTNPSLIVTAPIQYDEWSIGGDVRWEWRNLLVLGEAVYQQRDYANSARPTTQLVDPFAVGMPHPVPDHPRAAGYVLAGYRLPWYNLMPYAWFARAKDTTSYQDIYAFAGGLNWRIYPTIVAKAEYSVALLPNAPKGKFFEEDAMKQLQVQLAWAF